jgi:hypothetical protein
MTAVPVNFAQVVETQGMEPLVSGGVSVSADADETQSEVFVLPTDLHLQGAHITWCDCKQGDYAYVDVLTDTDVKIGGYNLDAGNPGANRGHWQLLGSSFVHIWNQNSITALLPAGYKLKAYLVTTAEVGTRKLAVNFMVRLPLA